MRIYCTGDAAQNISINRVTSQCFTNISAVSGPIVDISLNESFSSANITIPYDPSKHSDYQNLGLFTYNETRGMFVQVPATVDPVAHTLTATTNHFSIYTVFYIPAWNSLFSTPMDFGTPVPQNGPWWLSFPFNLASQSIYWFNSGSGFPAGPYKITAIGKYNLDSYVSLPYINMWEIGAIRAWQNNYGTGIFLLSDPAFGPNVENAISSLTIDHYVGSSSDSNQQAILRYNHPGGKIGLHVIEPTWTPNNNYGNLGYMLEYTGDNIMDHDGDGLNDVLETTGMLALGRMITTSPNNPDTDGDGLPDGVEIGELMVDPSTGLKYYKALSDPTKADSDEDHISDYDDYELGMNPLLEDTDHDGINDNIDENPLSYDNNKKPGMSELEIGRAIVLGAVFREMGFEGGLAAGFVDEKISSSIYYLIGLIGFSFIPGARAVACARDAVQYFLEGNTLQVALSLFFVFPLLSTLKVEGAVAKFIVENPGKEAEIAGIVVEDALKLAPDAVKAAILKAMDNAAVVALIAKNVPVDAIAGLVKRLQSQLLAQGMLPGIWK